jgi:hypothetical protein
VYWAAAATAGPVPAAAAAAGRSEVGQRRERLLKLQQALQLTVCACGTCDSYPCCLQHQMAAVFSCKQSWKL